MPDSKSKKDTLTPANPVPFVLGDDGEFEFIDISESGKKKKKYGQRDRLVRRFRRFVLFLAIALVMIAIGYSVALFSKTGTIATVTLVPDNLTAPDHIIPVIPDATNSPTAPVVSGHIWTVNVLTDSGLATCSPNSGVSGSACELRDALNKASSGDIINFTGLTGTIIIHSTFTVRTTLAIVGPGTSRLAIDGNKAVLIFKFESDLTASISGLTIQHGKSADAGGMINDGNLTISNVTFANNAGSLGGGLLNDGDLIVNNSTFAYNYGGIGGGIANNTTMTVKNSSFIGNSSSNGGGIQNIGTMTISNSTIFGNSATETGTGDGGGGIDNDGGTVTLSNSTIAGNSAKGSGGGINADYGKLNLISDIIAQNIGNGPDVFENRAGSVISLGYNLIGDGTGSGITPISGQPIGSSNGVPAAVGDQVGSSASPIDPKLRTLADNGGVTQTMALLANSPAIGKGDCNGAAGAIPPAPAVNTDQRGFTRSSPCDVGAY